MTLVRTSIAAVEVERTDQDDLQHHTIKLLLPSGDLYVTNYYNPSTSRLALHTVNVKESRHIVVGDFNSHSPSWGYSKMDTRGEEVEDWMMDNRLVLINHPDDTPTCYSRAWKTSTSPDLAMATEDIQKLSTRMVENQLGGSDHRPITISLTSVGCPKSNMAPSWNFKKANWNLFTYEADQSSHDISRDQHVNTNVHNLTQTILQAAKKSIPRGKRSNYKPFWSSQMRTLQIELDQARDKMEIDPTPENIGRHSTLLENYNNTKMKEIRNSWNEKTSNLDMDKDTSKMWKLTKTLNEDTARTQGKCVLEEDGHHFSDKMAANILADSYQECSRTNVNATRVREVRRSIKEKLQNQRPSPDMTSSFTIGELNAAIKKLKCKKAPGKDGICNDMIKHLGTETKEKFLLIINQSWESGKFPDSWKEAVIIPIKKKGKEKTQKTSYRPISLLSCLGKVMERMVNARLLKHLEENQLLSNTQSAYRKNRSTEDQLVYLAQAIENAFQEKKKVLAVFVDLAKAFDKVWKEGLLLKLLTKNVEGKMYAWIQDFLQHRTARVKLDGKISHRVSLQQGVPQGGVISPSLFLVFIDDIADSLTRHVPRALHADDFAAWCAAEHLSTATYRMQETMNHIGQWANDWAVEINTNKTVASVFSLSTQQETAKLKLNGQELKQEETPTYLGIKLDKRLTWKPHLMEVERRATRKLAIMKKLAGTLWGANKNILKKVYV